MTEQVPRYLLRLTSSDPSTRPIAEQSAWHVESLHMQVLHMQVLWVVLLYIILMNVSYGGT